MIQEDDRQDELAAHGNAQIEAEPTSSRWPGSPDGRFIALGDFSSGAIDIANKDGSGRHRVWTPPAGNGAGRMTWVP